MHWRTPSTGLLLLGVLLTTTAACRKKHDDDPGSAEQAYYAKQLVDLKAALAARDESKSLVNCIGVEESLPRMPKPVAGEMERLCYVDTPRLLLENAVRDAQDGKKHPELGDLSCMQLLAEDAFKPVLKHPQKDPALDKLVDEYTRLCPEAVAKFRAK